MNAIQQIGAVMLLVAIYVAWSLITNGSDHGSTAIQGPPVEMTGTTAQIRSLDPSVKSYEALAARVSFLESQLEDIQQALTKDRSINETLASRIETLLHNVEDLDSDNRSRPQEDWGASQVQAVARDWAEFEALEADFATQEIDSIWSEDAKRALSEAYSSPASPSPTIRSFFDRIECRSESCKVKVETGEDVDEMLESLLLRPDGLFAQISVHKDHMGDRVIFFQGSI